MSVLELDQLQTDLVGVGLPVYQVTEYVSASIDNSNDYKRFNKSIILNAQMNNQKLREIVRTNDDIHLTKSLFKDQLSSMVGFYKNLMLLDDQYSLIPEKSQMFICSLFNNYFNVLNRVDLCGQLVELARVECLLERALKNCADESFQSDSSKKVRSVGCKEFNQEIINNAVQNNANIRAIFDYSETPETAFEHAVSLSVGFYSNLVLINANLHLFPEKSSLLIKRLVSFYVSIAHADSLTLKLSLLGGLDDFLNNYMGQVND